MFSGCKGLTSFCGNLGSLTDGTNMFAGCSLDEESVIYIIDSLPTASEPSVIAIGVGDSVTSGMQTAYSQEASAKGWTVIWPPSDSNND